MKGPEITEWCDGGAQLWERVEPSKSSRTWGSSLWISKYILLSMAMTSVTKRQVDNKSIGSHDDISIKRGVIKSPRVVCTPQAGNYDCGGIFRADLVLGTS